ncbi:hypothetical protein [Chryseobacterium sp. BIGb0232]|uniref:hypothetical protein n=1 Tax=Chryseobacterium sp. BIGb0232 TaxID=2940598 RepID=UPI000F4929EB|nr:hypothetical protein [Chryseobacterium sp. BIGb0232]MCS4301396.1 hypothetical protein [Chryseobacterium sp. BIGb0232]ROS19746.1 hypothetical protein EDF65_0439 [Chryseobacterium nakagawai]
MNYQILTQHHLEFSIIMMNGRKTGIVRTTAPENKLSASLEDLFIEGYPDGFIETILRNIERALNDIDYDPAEDACPTFASVTVGKVNCVVRSLRKQVPLEIPTLDLKQILMAWTEYFEINDIQDMGLA